MKSEVTDIEDITSSHVQKLSFAIAAIAVTLSIFLSAQTMNLFVSFTTSGGFFLEKFHPSTILLALALFVRTVRQNKADPVKVLLEPRQAQRAIIALAVGWLGLCCLLVLRGQIGYVMVIVNNFLTPLILLQLSLNFTSSQIVRLASLVTVSILINCLLVWIEFSMGRTLLPVIQELSFFRPAGFAGHPILAGTYCVIGLLLIHITAAATWVRISISIFLFSALCIIGVRGSLLLGCLVFITVLAPASKQENVRRSLAARSLSVVIPLAMLFVAYQNGALERFATLGFWDDSAQSRFEIYDIFKFVTASEFWVGIPLDRLPLYLDYFGLAYVESPFIAQFVVGGITFAVLSHAIIFIMIAVAARSSKLLAFSLMFYTFTTLAFSSKTTIPLIFSVVFLVARSELKLSRVRYHDN